MKLRNLILSLALAAGMFGFSATSKAVPIYITFLNSSGGVFNYQIDASGTIGAFSQIYLGNIGGVTGAYETGYTSTTSPDFFNFNLGGAAANFVSFNAKAALNSTPYYFSVVSTSAAGVNNAFYNTQNQVGGGTQNTGVVITGPLATTGVPEPSTVAMSLLLGVGIVTFVVRRRTSSSLFSQENSLAVA